MFGNKEEEKFDIELFTIFDSKTKSYEVPTFATNQHSLVRDVMNLFRRKDQQEKNKFFLNAEDYSIFRIGKYSKSSGQVTSQILEHVANMHDLRATVIQELQQEGSQNNEMGIVGT